MRDLVLLLVVAAAAGAWALLDVARDRRARRRRAHARREVGRAVDRATGRPPS